MTEPTDRSDESTAPIHERVAAAREELRARAKILQATAAALGPLAKPRTYDDLGKLDPILGKARKKVGAVVPPPKLGLATLDAVDSWRTDRRNRLREHLGRDLEPACAAAGLTMRVVSRERPIEVRIPPFAVVFDVDRGSAEIQFAREPLRRAPADPEAIVAAVSKTKHELDRSFDPASFFDRCLAAWKAARVMTGSAERVEILDFLPYLALAMQGPKFKSSPTKQNFADYSRARFAYDVAQLRRQRGLARGGYRMNLGVATGTTATQKKRVVYMEDEDGNGEFKLTVFFTKEENQA